SGLIIMFDRAVKVGDRIELGAVQGDVAEIGARRTTLITNDGTAVILPNSRFITENVLNYAYLHGPIRLRVTLSVAGGNDPEAVQRLLCEVAHEHPDVLAEPAPAARLMGLQGGGALAFALEVWNRSRLRDKD